MLLVVVKRFHCCSFLFFNGVMVLVARWLMDLGSFLFSDE